MSEENKDPYSGGYYDGDQNYIDQDTHAYVPNYGKEDENDGRTMAIKDFVNLPGKAYVNPR